VNIPSLVDLSLDENPIAKLSNYKQTILQYINSLKQLDMKRLTVCVFVFYRLSSRSGTIIVKNCLFGCLKLKTRPTPKACT